MTEPALLNKLRLKPGQRAAVANAPPEYAAALAPLPDGLELVRVPAGRLGFLQVFARDVAELERLAPAALAALEPDGILWVSYPKHTSLLASDLDRDHG